MAQQYFEESHNILRQSMKKFVEREIMPYIDEWEDKEEFPRELFKKTSEAGLLGFAMAVLEAHGPVRAQGQAYIGTFPFTHQRTGEVTGNQLL